MSKYTRGNSTVAGDIYAKRNIYINQGTPTAKTVTATLTVAELLSKIITVNQGAGAACVLTTPTGTLIDAALPSSFGINDTFDVSIINISTVSAESMTVTAGTDVTIVGSNAVQSNDAVTSKSSGVFRFRKTAANTFVAYRIS